MITKKRLNQIINNNKCSHCGAINSADIMSAMTQKEKDDWNKIVHKGLLPNKDFGVLDDCDLKVVAEIE